MFFPSDFQIHYFSKHGGVTRGPFSAKPIVLLPVLFSLDPSAASLPPRHSFFFPPHSSAFSCYPTGHCFLVSLLAPFIILTRQPLVPLVSVFRTCLFSLHSPDGVLQAHGCFLMFSKSRSPAQTSYIQCLLSSMWISRDSSNINATGLVQATSISAQDFCLSAFCQSLPPYLQCGGWKDPPKIKSSPVNTLLKILMVSCLQNSSQNSQRG